MKTYQPITPEIIEKLKAITGPTYVKTDRDMLLQYQTDYETNPAMFHVPDAAVSVSYTHLTLPTILLV